MSKGNKLILEEVGSICTLTLNRPDKRNLLTKEMLTELKIILSKLKDENRIRCIVIRGSGEKAFSSGYDVTAIGENDMIRHHEGNHPLGKALEAIENFPYPVIAMMNGHAFGAGLEIAVTCDIRIAAEGYLLGMPPSKLGVVYSYSGMKKFLDLIGPGNTKELFLIGKPISSKRAYEIGLVNRLLPQAQIEEFAYRTANEISENAPLSLKTLKEIACLWQKNQTLNPENKELIRQMTLEVQSSDDYKEGQKAFSEKRKPKFKGK